MITISQYIIIRPKVTSLYLLIIHAIISVPPVLPLLQNTMPIPKPSNPAPRWSVSVSDMYNHGTTKVHYYTASVSYTRKNTRVQLSYGRNRAGYVCSGGVCRYTPAYTGANLVVTSSF